MSTTASPQHAQNNSDNGSWPEGEVAFVTGAASGIGLGIAKAFVAGGAKVALADIDETRLAGAAAELRQAGGEVTTIKLDVANPEDWARAADQAERDLGAVTVLCNNAGVNGGSSAEKTSWDIWRWVLSINLDSQFLGVSTFMPHFRKLDRPSHIMNTASMAGIVPMVDVAAYAASKFGSVGFTMVLRNELAESNTRVSLLCPGSVSTRIALTAEEGQAKLQGREANPGAAEANAALLAQGANPDRVGEQVVEAIGRDQFLIITHKEWLPLVKSIHHEIESAFEEFDGRHGVDPAATIMVQGGNPVHS